MKMAEDEEGSSSSSSDEEMEEDNKDDEALEEKIKQLQQLLASNPYSYDTHTQLLEALRSQGELDQLRIARNTFAKLFPLTPELWLQWIKDELGIASDDDSGQSAIKDLFERAVVDYLSLDLWLEYVSWSIGAAKDFNQVREVFERAITAVGLQVDKGTLIWDAYRDFESALLGAVEDQNSDAYKEQRNRLLCIFRRQFSQPLMNLETAFEDFKEFNETPDEAVENFISTAQLYHGSEEKCRPYIPLESGLEEATYKSLKLEQYKNYIDFELKTKDPARIQLIYERAITEHCLEPDLWKQYIAWLNSDLKVHSVTASVCERATRNCPWVFGLWTRRLQAMERAENDWENIDKVFDDALESGYSSATDAVQLWLCYIYMLRRKQTKLETPDYAPVLAAFERGSESMLEVFGDRDWDPEVAYRKAWAQFAALKCSDMEKARQLWQDILGSGNAKFAAIWLEFYNLERRFGTVESCRKLLYRALNSASDHSDTIGFELLQLENEEGTLADYEQALVKIAAQRKRTQEREAARMKKMDKPDRRNYKQKQFNKDKQSPRKEREQKPQKPSPPKKEKWQNKKEPQDQEMKSPPKAQKRPAPDPEVSTKDRDGFAIPSLPPPAKKQKAEEAEAQATVEPKPKVEEQEQDPTKTYDRSVFVSNLDFKLQQERLEEIFGAVGEISEIRLVPRVGGKLHKGFGFVQFAHKQPVEAALKLDRTPIEGRPMYVSRCEDKRKQPTQFRFGVGLEKNKLFVRNVNYEATEHDLKELFSEHGTVAAVRMVTHRDGKSKGCAYVDFNNADEASKALLKLDGHIFEGRALSVALSNPPSKPPPKIDYEARKPHSSKLQLLTPRALSTTVERQNKPKQAAAKAEANGEQSVNSASQKAKISNEQFREMLLKK